MTQVRELEQPLRAWRTFREIARATRTLAAARAIHWTELVRHAEAHLADCRGFARGLPSPVGPIEAARVLVAIGSDLGLCGALNREVGKRAAQLHDAPALLRIVIGARLAALEPLPGALELGAPSSLEAIELLAANIEGLCERASAPLEFELMIVVAGAIEADGRPQVELRLPEPAPEQSTKPDTRACVLGQLDLVQTQARGLLRHAQLIAALTRALASEHEARWRTMSRAYEAANRRIDEQEQRVRKLRQERITQEMLEARQAVRR